MRIPIATLTFLLGTTLSHANGGFHSYEFPGYKDLAQIPGSEFTVHQVDRPQPPRIQPPDTIKSTPPPSDAIVLFDGNSLNQFKDNLWSIVNGNIVAGEKGLSTKQAFGDFQMHLEWRTPSDPSIAAKKTGSMGNSGIYIMGKYEVQIYDSYSCKIYADGSAAAIYGQTPPLVNVCRKPGEWQSYDIAFKAPVFDGDKLVSPARITVIHNGVLVQNNTEILGPTTHKDYRPYEAHPSKLPIYFQGHSSPVQYRNIWIREL
ncbi:3-keto-disaccharide hydrolase [Pelagicoccus mobilis]|uniref:DUF1080 domain-containing protein n=1 Tax=Pelagicoccus mobilis TaxID=415221 RepID=A0A934RYR7_9BACT|nr:DUF1080 domain-containing protein [Pelagicoccus mobilis]MBK1879071.1 DUF1080 domain-containing protein [Pelagicoccus mobilis]